MSQLNFRNLLGLGVLIIVGALAAHIALNLRGDFAEDVVEVLPENVGLSMKGIDYTETSQGVRRWNLRAGSATHDSQAELTRVETVKMVFFDQNKGDIYLNSKRGEMHTGLGQVDLYGDVVLKTPEGYELNTNHLRYSGQEKIVSTNDAVLMTSDTIKVKGKGLRFEVETRTLRLLSDVEALIEDRSDDKVPNSN